MRISLAALLAALSFNQAPSPAERPELRTVVVAFSNEKGQPVEGLELEELALLENGVARDIAELKRDDRPLSVALLVDSSEALGSAYRLNVVDAVLRFLNRLPSGTRYTLWTTGDRPTRLVELTDDKSLAAPALRRTYPTGGNTMLDALVEATRELRGREGERSAVVVVSGSGIEFSNRPRERVVEEAKGDGLVFLVVQVDEAPAPFESRQNYDYVFGRLTQESGGLREIVLTSMGVETALRKLAADLSGRYRLRYATLPELKERRLEVEVARPGVRARVVGEAR